MSGLTISKWFIILLPIINVILLVCGVYDGTMSTLEWIGGEVCCVVASFCLIYFVIGRKSKCPHCKKPFALKKTNQEVVSEEKVSVLVENKTRNNDGKVTGTAEQYVPGIRTTYKVYYTCKHCGEVTCRTMSESHPML